MTKPTKMLSVVTSATILLIGYLPAAFGHEVSLSCPVVFGPIPDASGLIAYYPLDGNTADVSGNSLDAIEVSAAEPAEGKVGQGYYFNGKDSFIRLPLDISPHNYPQITITAWIKPEAVNGARYIVNQGDHGNIGLFMSNGAVSAVSTARVGNPKHTVYAGRWAFVALTYDHTTGTAVLLSNTTFSDFDQVVIPELARPSVLLGAKAPGNSGFAGTIDEVRIYNQALTIEELAGLNRAGKNESVAGTNQLPGGQPESLDRSETTGVDNVRVAGGSAAMDQTTPLLYDGPAATGGPLRGIDAVAVTKPIDKTGPVPIGQSTSQPGQPLFDENPQPENPTQLPGDQFERPSAEDIPTRQDFETADQNVDYVVDATVDDGTRFLLEQSNNESSGGESSGSGSGGMRATQHPLTNESTLKYAPGEPHLTAMTGKLGSIVRSVKDKNPDSLGTDHFWGQEKFNKLCNITTAFGSLSECGSGSNLVPAVFRQTTLAPGVNSSDYRVTAIQVCTRRSNDRVKGIRFASTELTSGGLGSAWQQDEFTFPNCNDNWKTAVRCPSGQIASGYKAFFSPGAGTSRKTAVLVGLQLYCRALTVVPAD